MTKKRPRHCAGKHGYETLEAARAAAFHLARRKQEVGEPIASYLRAYKCSCGKFHFGKTRGINWEAVK